MRFLCEFLRLFEFECPIPVILLHLIVMTYNIEIVMMFLSLLNYIKTGSEKLTLVIHNGLYASSIA